VNVNVYQVVKDLRAELGDSVEIIGWRGMAPIPDLFAGAGDAARGVHIIAAVPPEGLGLRPDQTGRASPPKEPPAGIRFFREFEQAQPEKLVTNYSPLAAGATEVMLDAIAR
jgi:hypothetical protein